MRLLDSYFYSYPEVEAVVFNRSMQDKPRVHSDGWTFKFLRSSRLTSTSALFQSHTRDRSVPSEHELLS